MPEFTLIIPYYRAPNMLRRQMEEIRRYPFEVRVIVVDDGSPEPAIDAIHDFVDPRNCRWGGKLRLYRIGVDIPWNREGARNLAARECETDWLVHVDIDHVMPVASVKELLRFEPDTRCWYRFPRFRVGKADETRRKDAIAPHVEFGEIKPHIDSYLCTKAMYWQAGGYDEDFVGHLGGGSAFLEQMSLAGEMRILPDSMPLHVHTRHSVPDASISTLSRDTSHYKALHARKRGQKGKNPIRFEWSRVI